MDLSQAERIVAVGRGIKGPEHFPLAQALAAALGAELAASRPICDNGWLPMERQIGSSGQTVAPKLYVAVGISGAIQHVVGMKGARTIVAINKDADAPDLRVADYGFAGDLFEFLPALTELSRHKPMGRETLEVDVLIVGGGPAGLSAALRLAQLQKAHGASRWRSRCSKRRARPARTCCRVPCSIRRRSRSWSPTSASRARRSTPRARAIASTCSPVRHDPLSDHAAAAAQPRQLRHLGEPVRQVARGAGRSGGRRPVSGFAGVEVLFDGDRVVGVRTGDRGIGKDGERRTFEPGVDIHAKVTISAMACAAT